jgi:hypothetical protein
MVARTDIGLSPDMGNMGARAPKNLGSPIYNTAHAKIKDSHCAAYFIIKKGPPSCVLDGPD